MLNVLVSGKLATEPQTRTATNGNRYVTASVATTTAGGESILVGVLAFAETACERLAQLHKGDAIAATGEAKLTAWSKGGDEHHGLSVTVVEVLTVYVARQRRNQASAREPENVGAA